MKQSKVNLKKVEEKVLHVVLAKPGDRVWVMHANEVKQVTIYRINRDIYQRSVIDRFYMNELGASVPFMIEQMFPFKEYLIKSL